MIALPEADLTQPPDLNEVGGSATALPGGWRLRAPEETVARVRPFYDALGLEHLRIDVNEGLPVAVYWGYHRQKYVLPLTWSITSIRRIK